MIKFFSGTPGSGKSFHMTKEIVTNLRLRRNVIATVNINVKKISNNGRRRIGDFVYVPILDLEPKFLYQYAFANHKKGKEGQTLLVIDECQILFNPREYHNKQRPEWILFFTKHRHLGYKIIMISQFDRLVDRQIRSLFEYEIKHRKVNNLLFFLPFTVFALVEYWYGAKVIISKRMLIYSKSVAALYDSYVMFDEIQQRYPQYFEDVQTSICPAGAEMGLGGPHCSDRRLDACADPRSLAERVKFLFFKILYGNLLSDRVSAPDQVPEPDQVSTSVQASDLTQVSVSAQVFDLVQVPEADP